MIETIVVIDYGSGNLHSAAKALEHAAIEANIRAQIVISADAAWCGGRTGSCCRARARSAIALPR